MTLSPMPDPNPVIIRKDSLQSLIDILLADGYQVIGPRYVDDAIALENIARLEDLPAGLHDRQDGGVYRIERAGDEALFGHGPGPQGWKRYLYPPVERLWKAQRSGEGFAIEDETSEIPKYAFLGVRACDLRAMDIQDAVFDEGRGVDPRYMARRRASLVIAVNCTRAGGTCFCASMETGPRVGGGFDLALTEIVDVGRHEFLVEVGSDIGAAVLARVDQRAASGSDLKRADAAISEAAASMGREMVPDAAELLARNLENPHWDEVAKRCLSCGNCTMVCPTCFCTTVEDTTDLAGESAERWRKWDSCFSVEFSYIHGGSIRRETAARYRQWITHKLSTWHEQFGTSGCVGCGRCITWCPVGIDITEEARAIRDSEGSLQDG